jgi:hypothetical protein
MIEAMNQPGPQIIEYSPTDNPASHSPNRAGDHHGRQSSASNNGLQISGGRERDTANHPVRAEGWLQLKSRWASPQ